MLLICYYFNNYRWPLCVCVWSGSGMRAGVAGDAESWCPAASGWRPVGGALHKGHVSAGCGKLIRVGEAASTLDANTISWSPWPREPDDKHCVLCLLRLSSRWRPLRARWWRRSWWRCWSSASSWSSVFDSRSCRWSWSPCRGRCRAWVSSSPSTRRARWRTLTGPSWNTSESRESAQSL